MSNFELDAVITTGVERLVLLKRSEDAQAMLVTWPRIGSIVNASVRRRRWADVTGLDDLTIERLEPMLLQNGFCLAGGDVDKEALQLVQVLMIKELGIKGGTGAQG